LGLLSDRFGGNPSLYFSEAGAWIFMQTLVKGINDSKPNENADEKYLKQEIWKERGHEYLA